MHAIDMCIEGCEEYYFEAPDFSRGMLENLLLAIATALMLGANEERIQSRIETLKPVPMRGSIVETQKAKYYLDCYNASPTSMRDALAHFAEISADAPHKLYVLGTMAELGLAAHRHHREIGMNIPAEETSRAILVGANADVYKSGMLEKGWDEARIEIFQNAADAKASVENFEDGFVFVKGSRVCELEKALPDDVLAESAKPAEKSEQVQDPEEEEEESSQPESAEQPKDSEDASDDEADDEFDDCEFDENAETISREPEDERDL